jgi:KDO2-lipid IV(A) lauroyltransferase
MMKKVVIKIIRALMVLVAKLPLKFHYFMGDVLSWIAKNVVRYRTGVVWMNISRAFPEKKYWELKKIYNDFYRHFGEIFAEAIWFGGSSYERLNKAAIVTIKNPEVLDNAYNESPSVTMLCSHCGNWEILGGIYGYMTKDGFKCSFTDDRFTVVYKKMSSDVADRVFAENRVAALVNDSPNAVIETKSILRFSIENKGEKRVYGYPADQAPFKGMGRHYMGLFLNQQTYAMTGSVGVACKLHHSVLYLKMKHVARGKYEWEFVPICSDAADLTPDELMRKYYTLLEQEINETPHNWLWTHNRWKIK